LNVERSIPNIYLNHEQLLALVSKAFPACNKLDEWGIISGGACNTTYKFMLGDSKFVLRLYVRNRTHCKTEQVIHQLIDGQVSTPKLIYTNESHEPWAYSIFEFVSGSHISEVATKSGNFLSYELGHVLATIHNFKLPQAGLFGDGMTISHVFKIGSSPYFEEAFSIISKGKFVRQRLGDQLADKTISFMQENKDFFPIVEDNVSLTHSDFKPVNLLYHEKKVFVLDWEFAHAGIGIFDFAILMRHRDQFPCKVEELIKGYTDFGGILPKDWFRSALITDFVNTLQLLDSLPERPQLFQQLKTAIQSTIDDWNSVQEF